MKKFYAVKILARYCLPVCFVLQAQILPVQADSFVYDPANTDVAPHYLDEAIWTTAGAPGTGDSVYLTPSTASSIDVYYRYTGTAPYFDTVSVDNQGGTTTSLWSSGSVSTPLLSSRVAYVGVSGNGAFYLRSGAVQSVTDYMYLASNSTGTGTYTMSGGTLQATDDGFNLYAGRNGDGYFYQSAGTVNLGNGYLYVGNYSTSTGDYQLSGTGSLTAYTEDIGYYGTGTFVQSGGSHAVTNSMALGYYSGSTGTYTMSGGALQATDSGFNIYVADYGTGTFSHSGGSVDLGAGNLYIGMYTGGNGSYELSGTGSLTAYNEYIGYYAAGTFTQSGGTHQVTNTMYLGRYLNASGTYTMTGGSLEAADASFWMHLGDDGTGTFNQSGGTVDLGGGNLFMGYGVGTGNYNLSDTGSLATNVTDVGSSGTATFTQDGGSHTVNDKLWVGSFLDSSDGTYYLNGGSLAAPLINNYDAFSQSGGTITASSVFQNYGSYSHSGGNFLGHLYLYEEGSFSFGTEFTAGNGITNDDFFTIYSGRTLYANGLGFTNNNQLSLYGTLGGNGQIVNNGRMYASGTISGSGGFINDAIFEQTGDLTITKYSINENNMFFDLGYQDFLTLNGGNFENNGIMTMDSSIITGSASLVNKAGGTLKGDGLISTAFSNEGRLLVTGNTTVSQAFTNSGIVEMADVAADLGGGSIDNIGTIHGIGKVSNPISNSGTIEPLNGTLTLSGVLANSSSGKIEAAAGGKLLMTQGLAVNAGLISLQGGTVDNNGSAMTNDGQITGYGSLRTGGLANNADMLLAGGSSTVDGTVTNNATGTIEVAHGHATFDDVVNNGLFKTTNASVSFAGDFTNNGTYFSDPSLQTFTDLVVSTGGALVGLESGDIFQVSGNFFNFSANNTAWNTSMAWLEFTTGVNGTDHIMSLAGADFGARLAGYRNNFAWGQLDISGDSLYLSDGNDLYGGAFYVGSLLGLEIDSANNLAGNIFGGDGLNIYYLAGLDENAYLGGLTYDLLSGGQLIAVAGDAMPTPIPGGVWLLGSGLAGLLAYRRKQGK